MKKWYVVIIALFLIPLVCLGIYSAVDADATVSESENRTLASFPKFSFEKLFSGEWTKEFETYYSDTFPLRSNIMDANRVMNAFYVFSPIGADSDDVTLSIDITGDQIANGGEAAPIELTDTPEQTQTPIPISTPTSTQSADGAEGKDETSELDPANTPTLTPPPPPELNAPETADLNTGVIIICGDRAMEIPTFTSSIMSNYAAAINGYAESMPNTRVISLVAPNGGAFYAPNDYLTGSHDQKAAIQEMYDQLNENIVKVDAYTALRYHADEYIYFRTDHHWSQLGAYYAYTAFCDALGLEAYDKDDSEKFETGVVDGDFVGSMYSYTSKYAQSAVLKNNPDKVHFWRPIRDFSSRVYKSGELDESTAYGGYVISSKVKHTNKYLAFISGDNPVFTIKTDVGNGKSIAVIKESYGNAFVPWLINHYENIYVIDPRKFNTSKTPSFDLPAFVEKHAIDDLLVIDYPLVMSNQAYVNYLNRMVK